MTQRGNFEKFTRHHQSTIHPITSPLWGGRKSEAFSGGGMRKRLKAGTIDRARQLRGSGPDTERLLWWKLRELNTRGYHFRRQVPMRGYFLDFAEHGGRIAIELDGSQHGLQENVAHDARRDCAIEEEGYRVLRFWNGEIKDNLDGVVETILREIDQRRPPTRIASLSDLPTRGR